MLQTQYNIAPNLEIIGSQSQLNGATAGRFAKLFCPVICDWVVRMCAPTLARKHAGNLGAVYCENNLCTAVWYALHKAGSEKRLMRPSSAQTQLAGGDL